MDKVNCYSGHTYAERPQSFRWEDKSYQIAEIERTWLEPGRRCFQVRSSDNQHFRLFYDEVDRYWSIIELTS